MRKFLKNFKKDNNLDFRKNKYYEHSYFYNCKYSTYFDYDFARKIVINLNDELEKEFEKQKVIYNVEMDIESLKVQKLKDYIISRVDDYFNNY